MAATIFNLGGRLEKQTAEALMKSLGELSSSMNTVAADIERVEVVEQKLHLRKGIADMMGALYADLMRPIIREYPELDPDKL
jgi:hypothetical protein